MRREVIRLEPRDIAHIAGQLNLPPDSRVSRGINSSEFPIFHRYVFAAANKLANVFVAYAIFVALLGFRLRRGRNGEMADRFSRTRLMVWQSSTAKRVKFSCLSNLFFKNSGIIMPCDILAIARGVRP